MNSVYYLVHWESARRIRYYKTLTGARIACRLRNLHLGFLTRINYEHQDNRTYELCANSNSELVRGTYAIEEDVIDTPDLLEA
jgi:hypothetical protein